MASTFAVSWIEPAPEWDKGIRKGDPAKARAQVEALLAGKPLPKLKPKPLELTYEDRILRRPAEAYLRAMGQAPILKRQYRCGRRTWASDATTYTVPLKDPAEWPCGHQDAESCGRSHKPKDGGLETVETYLVQTSPGYWATGSLWSCGCLTTRKQVHAGKGVYADANDMAPCALHRRGLCGRKETGEWL